MGNNPAILGKDLRDIDEIVDKRDELIDRVSWLEENTTLGSSGETSVHDSGVEATKEQVEAMAATLEWVLGARDDVDAVSFKEGADEFVDPKVRHNDVLVTEYEGDKHIISKEHTDLTLQQYLDEDYGEVRTCCGMLIDIDSMSSTMLSRGVGICSDCIEVYEQLEEQTTQRTEPQIYYRNKD